MIHLSTRERLTLVLVAAISLGALHPLLLDPHWVFGSDWSTHTLCIGFQSEFLRQHHYFAPTLNTDALVGIPYPVFYAVTFHPPAAVLATVMGVDWAVRLLFLILLATQTWQIRKLCSSAGSGETIAWLAAALMAWATYALTNLCTRGAMAEWVGASLLVSATASLLRSALPGSEHSRLRLLFQGAYFYAFSAGSHPITGLLGALFIIAVFTPFFVSAWRKLWLPILGGALLVFLLLVAWLYAFKQFKGTLSVEVVTMSEKGAIVRERGNVNPIIHFPKDIDSISSRLWPLPRDIRVEQAGLSSLVSTPYLDAQLSVPLAALAAGISVWLWRSRRRGAPLAAAGCWLWGISWAVFLVAFILSVWPAAWEWIPRTLHIIQFAYRLVTYQNLALLTAIVGALLAVPSGHRAFKGIGWRGNMAAKVFLGAVSLSGLAGLVVMSSHIAAIKTPRFGWQFNPDIYTRHQPDFYGWWAYSVLGTNADNQTQYHGVSLRVGLGESFGRAESTPFHLTAPTNVCLHVQPFPWNRVLLDGQPLDLATTRTRPEGYVVPLPPGKHEVAYQWQPDRTWVRLDALSKFTVLGGGLVVLCWAFFEALRAGYARVSSAETPPPNET